MSILLSKISNSWNNIIGKKELDNSQTLRGKEVAGDGAPVDEKQETQILKEKYELPDRISFGDPGRLFDEN